MRNILITIIALIGWTSLMGQQEQMFTQYMFNKLALNPAYAGNENYLGLTAQLRDQWNGFPGAPEAQLISVNLPRYTKVGVGFNLKRRSIGIARDLSMSGIYAYKIPLSFGMFSMGVEASIRNRMMDFTDGRLVATQGLELDPSIPSTMQVKNSVNLGFGMYLNSNNYYLGVSVPRLGRSDLDFDENGYVSEEVRHLFLMGGGTIPINKDLRFTAQGFMKFAENTPFDTDVNFSLTLSERYTAGIGYRFGGAQGDIGESVALMLAFNVTDQLLVAFSQDFTLSDIRSYDNGSFELVASYAFGKKKERVVLLNPRFF